jgi:colicin import membrane protein
MSQKSPSKQSKERKEELKKSTAVAASLDAISSEMNREYQEKHHFNYNDDDETEQSIFNGSPSISESQLPSSPSQSTQRMNNFDIYAFNKTQETIWKDALKKYAEKKAKESKEAAKNAIEAVEKGKGVFEAKEAAKKAKKAAKNAAIKAKNAAKEAAEKASQGAKTRSRPPGSTQKGRKRRKSKQTKKRRKKKSL